MSHILSVATLICLWVASSCSAATSLEELMLATCRVERSRARGSGCVFAESEASYYILTNYHVVGSKTIESIQVRFFNGGMDRVFSGRVVAVAYTPNQWADVAVIELPKSQLQGLQLPVVPLLPDGEQRLPEASERTTIWTCGCPGGKWPSLMEGRAILEPTYHGAVKLHPSVEGGRSGSPVFSRIGGEFFVTGLVGWRDKQDRWGIAMTIGQVKALLLQDRPVSTQSIPQHIERSNLETFESAEPVGIFRGNCRGNFCRRPQSPLIPGPHDFIQPPPEPNSPGGPLNPWEQWEQQPSPTPGTDNDLLTRITALETALAELRDHARDQQPGPAGPQGPPGRDGKDIDPAQLEELLAVIEELKTRSRRVVLIDNGQIIDDESYGPDEPIVLDIRRIVRQEQ